jgi:sugar lactone lactonase YvrE
MDFLQAWGPYAPALFYLWLSIAYAIAYLRTRKTHPKEQISGLFFVAIFALVQPLSLFQGLGENPSTIQWVNYVMYLCWPLVLLVISHGVGKGRTTAGYHHPIDVLLLRPPHSTENDSPSEYAHASRRHYFSASVFLVLLAALLAGVSFIGVGLQACGWLDIMLERSGCLRSIAIDSSTVESVAFSPDGSLFAAGGSEQTIRLYRVADGQLQRIFSGHTDWVTSVAFSPDRALIASGSWDGTVRLWRVADGTLLRVLPMPTDPGHKTIVVTFSPDGALLAAASYGIDVQLWRVADGTLVHSFPSAGEDVAFSPDGKLLAVEQPEHNITLWQISEGRALRTLAGHPYGITGLAFAPDGQTLFSASGSEKAMKMWRMTDGMLLQTIPAPARSNLSFSPDGKYIASGGMNNNIQGLRGLVELWNVAEGNVAGAWEAHRTLVNSVAFSPDGKMLVSGSSWETVRLWRIKP